VPIIEGDRVQTNRSLNGTVELLSDDGTLAHVQLDGSTGGPNLTICDTAELAKVGEVIPPVAPQ
jgi:hypothetical protein